MNESFLTRSGGRLHLRCCTSDDATKFPDFQKTTAAETQFTLQGDFNTPDVDTVKKHWGSSESNKRVLNLGAFDESGKLIGFLGFYPANDKHPWISHVGRFWMVILKAYWGNGLGRRMLEILDAFASSNGFTRIEAEVRSGNDRAIKLYENAGYVVEGTRKHAILVDGTYFNNYYIAKVLSRRAGDSDARKD